ncbi:hypothetical protein [Chitinophaga sp. sic0106]|uniref:hypothetical protein n=1 Tax=Chitinophaga sp. sic0106 TaxID=2854785 RepID=UPI001C44938D|nr:hypothetical protein [Chitinophaga sp. sic0106]MBV7533765.1 hypothetical protein [Chitinophaga sp. sic0106]
MANTGKKHFALLVQYSATTGLPTGVLKPNVPGDPDYVEPVVDGVACPFTPIQDTQFVINNYTSREQAGPVTYEVITGANMGTLQATESTSFAEPGENHYISFQGERIGTKWRYTGDTITYDFFVFKNGKLSELASAGNIGQNIRFFELTGNILINVVSSDRGYYSQASAVAFQIGTDIGTASFSFTGNDGNIVVLDSTNTFGSYDVDYYHPAPDFNGTNSNDYPLLMEITTYDGDWVPIDPDDPDGEWRPLPVVNAETIEAGATINRNFSAEFGGDFFIRISKK